jgi:murein DD-endopeptidase MepM/ murein hydrolase activator NlpD
MMATTVGLAVSGPSSAGAASIGSDKSQIQALEAAIAHEGLVIQGLVEKENQVRLRLQGVEQKITAERANLRRDKRAERAAAARLRQVALNTYVNAASGSVNNSLLASSSATVAAEQQAYSGVAGGVLTSAISNFKNAEYHTASTEAALSSSKVHLAADLTALGTAQASANAALANEAKTLRGVKGNLVALVTARAAAIQKAAAARRERLQAARERKLREQQALQQQQSQSPAPPTPPSGGSQPPSGPPPARGSYGDPLRAVSGLTSERIDQGVDYSGFGPIYAIGDATILSTVNGGWPGGTFIAYRLNDGPAQGLVVYAAEDIQPEVSVGQQVSAGTVIGRMYGGPDGIETGWADGSALGESMAAASGQFGGGNSTAFGYNFSQFLQYLGAPGGILQNNPPTGSLPSGWPNW